ncbi:up-regulator of cell proliferation isoform 2-T2 [Sarcophilus harrisii]
MQNELFKEKEIWHSDLGEVVPEGKDPETTQAEQENTDGTEEAQENGQPIVADFLTEERSRLHETMSLLGLETYCNRKLSLQDARQISFDSMKNWAPQVPTDLPWSFLRKLLALNSEVRNTTLLSDLPQDDRTGEKETQVDEQEIYWGTSEDIYSLTELVTTPDVPLNPLDLLCALLLCSDSFLQQELLVKMSLCQFALPVVLPDSETQNHTFLLWALRGVMRTWWWQPPGGPRTWREESLVLTRVPIISFARMDISSHSKSHLLNAVMSPSHHQPHDYFCHREMPSAANAREIADGLVEMSWYSPGSSSKENLDVFPEPVAFANLRGEIGSHWQQFKLLTETSAAVFILTDNIGQKEYELLCSLSGSTTRYYLILSPYRGKRNANLRFLNKLVSVLQIDYSHVLVKVSSTDSKRLVKRLQAIVVNVIKSASRKVSLEDMAETARTLGLKVDEDCEECQKARERVEKITQDIQDVELYKREKLRLQGDPWRSIAQVEKELCRLQRAGDSSPEKYKSELRQRLLALRMHQNRYELGGGMQEFIKGIANPSLVEKQYFLGWMKLKLEEMARQGRRQPPEALAPLGPKHSRPAELSEQLWPTSLGVEHFLREMGQFYEAECYLVEAGKMAESQKRFTHFVGLASELVLSGFPLELMDRGTCCVPLRWVTGILRELHARLEGRPRLLVLSVLGAEGTGKSTLLNTMFGLQFATSRSYKPHGTFMQLISVTEDFRQDLGCDFILVIDSGGLTGGAVAARGERYELEVSLATLAMGLSNITVVSMAETKDTPLAALHAFLKLEKLGHVPNCQLVSQDLSDGPVPRPNPRDRKQLLEQLNDLSKAVAEMEKQDEERALSDTVLCDPEKHIWHIPRLWHGMPPMAPVSLGYCEAVFELKRCLLENIRNGVCHQHRDIVHLVELVGRL